MGQLAADSLQVPADIKPEGGSDAPLQMAEQLVKHFSPVVSAILPLLRGSFKKFGDAVLFQKLTFLEQLRSVPRTTFP